MDFLGLISMARERAFFVIAAVYREALGLGVRGVEQRSYASEARVGICCLRKGLQKF